VEIAAPSSGLDDIRLQPELGGGALADLGCYGLDLILWLSDDPRPQVAKVQATRGATGVDVRFEAALHCSDGLRECLRCAIDAAEFRCQAIIATDAGTVLLESPFLPAVLDPSPRRLFAIRTGSDARSSKNCGKVVPSYAHQLRAFRDCVSLGRLAPGAERATVSRAALISDLMRVLEQPCP
jgi:predicted dehydrogenase